MNLLLEDAMNFFDMKTWVLLAVFPWLADFEMNFDQFDFCQLAKMDIVWRLRKSGVAIDDLGVFNEAQDFNQVLETIWGIVCYRFLCPLVSLDRSERSAA